MCERPDYPVMCFIEKRDSNDPANGWMPNRARAQGMRRRAGFAIPGHPEEEVYLCRVNADAPKEPLP